MIESHIVEKEDPQILTLWHDRLSHSGSIMMQRIVESSHGHPLKGQQIFQMNKVSCEAYSLSKLITRPLLAKIESKSHLFFERIQGDICGPIHQPCGLF